MPTYLEGVLLVLGVEAGAEGALLGAAEAGALSALVPPDSVFAASPVLLASPELPPSAAAFPAGFFPLE